MYDRTQLDGEIATACFVAVKKYCLTHKEDQDIQGACQQIALDTLKSEYRRRKGYRAHQALSQEDFRGLNDLYNRIWHEVESKAMSIALALIAKKKTMYIMKISAEAMIRATMAEKGFPSCTVESQRYRAKVNVKLPSGYKAQFYIKYTDIMGGRLDEEEDRFLEMCRQIESLPFTIKLWK